MKRISRYVNSENIEVLCIDSSGVDCARLCFVNEFTE